MRKYRNDVSFGSAFEDDSEFNEHVPLKMQRTLRRHERQLMNSLIQHTNNYMLRVAKLRDAQQQDLPRQRAIDNFGFAVALHHVSELYAMLLLNGDCSPAFCVSHFIEAMSNVASNHAKVVSAKAKTAVEALLIQQAAQANGRDN